MTPDRWRQITAVFHAARAQEAAVRAALLDEACAGDPALRAEVDALLGAHEVLSQFEELGQGGGMLEEPGTGAAGTDGSFGPYRVIGELGEGGMGVVHLAERSDGQFVRRVAIKRVGTIAPRADLLRRFRDEREIQARLDHPNIARLLDAGLDPGGVPYLVIEHVEGVPLTSHCHERRLGVRPRLDIFLKVCAAVRHAHQNLVIHRDIKPGNILVTAEGEPKLLDFGIAKVLSETQGDDATRTANRALTLDYASPEQLRGEAITTASDVYSLGVLLYELLADAKPYVVATLSLTDAVRQVCESVPPPVSRVAPPERRPELAGDLDLIVAKALEKVAADRYGSVAELAADLESHRQHQPVKARRPSFGYVARKFLRRHRAAALVGAVVLVLLAGGLAAVLWQARVAERERARAQQRFEQVRQLASFVIFDLQDGMAKLTGSTELRRMMVERSLAYLDSLAGDAADDASLQKELAGAYVRLGDVAGRQDIANVGDQQAAAASYAKAEDLLRRLVAVDPRDRDSRQRLAGLLEVLLMVGADAQPEERERSLKRIEEATGLWEELVREDPGDPKSLHGLASAHLGVFTLKRRSDAEAALTHLERALQILQGLLEARPQDLEHKRVAAECYRMQTSVFRRRDPDRALESVSRAARLDSERVAAEPQNAGSKLDLSRDYTMLGDLHLARGQHQEALRYYGQALPLRRELWEADRANTLAWNQLAHILMRTGEIHVLAGQPGLAGPFLRESIELTATRPDQKQHWVTGTLARAYLSLGEVEFAAGRSPCRSYRRLEELQRELPGLEGYFPPETTVLRDRARDRLRSCPA